MKTLTEVLDYNLVIIYNTTTYRSLLIADLIDTYTDKNKSEYTLRADLTSYKNKANVRIEIDKVIELLKAKNYFKQTIANPVKM